jgi:hypothetical protein
MEPEGSLPHSQVCLSLSWASPIQSIPPHPTSWRSILILSSHLHLGLLIGLFTSRLKSYQSISPDPRLYMWIFRNKNMFSRWGVVSPSPNPKLEYHPLSAVRGCSFNTFAATLHVGGRFSIRNLRTRHAVVTGTHLLHRKQNVKIIQLAIEQNKIA